MKTRRDFLKTTLTSVAATWTLPTFLHHTALSMESTARSSGLQAATGRDNPILVVLQLGGGNDGLNTVVPFNDDAYHRARPRLAIPASDLIKLDDHLGLPSALRGVKELFDDGHAAIINGVGYPNPNRSHFRSMEIWHTASDSDKNEYYGWLGRYFDNVCQGAPDADPEIGISIGNAPPQAFHGTRASGIAMRNPQSYQFMDQNDVSMGSNQLALEDGSTMSGGSIGLLQGAAPSEDAAGNLDFLRRTTMDAEVSSQTILNVTRNQNNTLEYPRSRLATDLALVAKLIAGGLPTRVYYVNHGGFDTHANQSGTHARLLTEFSQSVSAFCQDLRALGVFDRVMVMCFSEFGRRVAENASGGTDHGVAGPMFLFGGAIKPGLHGRYPDLTDLDKGDLKHQVDFRQVYATILDRWLKTDSTAVLKSHFPTLDLVV